MQFYNGLQVIPRPRYPNARIKLSVPRTKLSSHGLSSRSHGLSSRSHESNSRSQDTIASQGPITQPLTRTPRPPFSSVHLYTELSFPNIFSSIYVCCFDFTFFLSRAITISTCTIVSHDIPSVNIINKYQGNCAREYNNPSFRFKYVKFSCVVCFPLASDPYLLCGRLTSPRDLRPQYINVSTPISWYLISFTNLLQFRYK